MSEDLIRPNPPGFVAKPDDKHLERLALVEQNIVVLLARVAALEARVLAAKL